MIKTDYTDIVLQEIETLTLKKPAVTESLLHSGLLDSITVVDLVVALEEKTGCQISISEIAPEDFETAEQINLFLQKRLNA